MKPTQEQVIAWAREAGMEVGAGLLMKDVYGQSPSIEHIQVAFTLAYEAGRKDENEACAKVLDEMAAKDKLSNYYKVAALAIRERGAP